MRDTGTDSLTFSSARPSGIRFEDTGQTGSRTGLSCLFSDSESDMSDGNMTGMKTEKKSSMKNSIKQTKEETPKKRTKEGTASSLVVESSKPSNSAVDVSVSSRAERAKHRQGKTEICSKNIDDSAPNAKSASVSSDAKKRKFSSEQSVLESAGVLHTHVNPRVVGSSRAEDHMTRCAIQDVFELHTNTQAPAVQCDPLVEVEEEKEVGKKSSSKLSGRSKGGRVREEDHNKPRCVKFGSFKLLLGQTPTAITRQHWQDLCAFKGLDQVSMAESVLRASVEERVEMLRAFYCHRHPQLADTVTTTLTTKPPAQKESSTEKKPNQSYQRSRPSVSTKNESTGSAKRQKAGAGKGKSSASHPAKSSKTSVPQTRRLEHKDIRKSSLFFCETMKSESQESITAHSPDRDIDSSLAPDSEGFSPAPRAKRPTKQSPSKSSLTRIRPKGQSSAGRDRRDASLIATSSYVPDAAQPSYLASILEGGQTLGKDLTDQDNQSLIHPSQAQDVGHLLGELGKTSSQANAKRHASVSILPSSGLGRSKAGTSSSTRSKDSVHQGKDRTHSRGVNRDNYKSLLDNIFSMSSDEDVASADSSESNVDSRVPADMQRERDRNDSSELKITELKTLDGPKGPKYCSPDVAIEKKKSLPVSARDKSGPPEMKAESSDNDDGSFDDLLNNSTLRDEGVDCFGTSGKKKKRVKVASRSAVHFSWRRHLNEADDLGEESARYDPGGHVADDAFDDSDSLFS